MVRQLLTASALAVLLLPVGCTTPPPQRRAEEPKETAETTKTVPPDRVTADQATPGEPAAQAPERVLAPKRPTGPLEQQLPPETLVCLSLDDASRIKDRLKETALYAICNEDEVQTFLKKPIGKLKGLMAEAEAETGLTFDDILGAFTGQTSVALVALEPGEGQPSLTALVLARLADPAAAGRFFDWLLPLLKKELRREGDIRDLARQGWRGVRVSQRGEPNGLEITVALSDDLALGAVHGTGDATVEALLSGRRAPGQRSLADADDYSLVAGKLGTERVCTLYCAADRLREAIMRLVRKEEPEDAALAEKILEKLGLEGLMSFGAGLTVDPPGLTHRLYVRAPAPRKGVLKILADRPLDERVRRVAPDDAMSFQAGRVDIGAAMEVIRDVAGAAGATDEFEKGLAQLKGVLGLDLEADLLRCLSGQMIVMSFPMEMAANPMIASYQGLAFGLELGGPAKARQSVETLLALADAMLKARGAGQFDQFEYEGVTARYVNLMGGMIAPCVAVSEDHLVLAGGIAAAKQMLRLLKANPRPLVETDEFRELARRVGGADGPQISYSDPRRSLPQAMSSLMPMFGMMQAGGGGREIAEWVDLALLPSPKSYTKHLFSQLDVAWFDDEGILFVGYGPFGGSGAPALTAVAGGGVAAGMLIPALATAREKARRTKCMSNLKQIGVACHVYSTDHRDRFPKSLSELVPKYIEDQSVFECPSNPGLGAYEYVSGLDANGRPTWVLIFDKVANHDSKGRNVLYLDGHVEWQSEDDFQENLNRTLKEAAQRGYKTRVIGVEQGGGNGPDVELELF